MIELTESEKVRYIQSGVSTLVSALDPEMNRDASIQALFQEVADRLASMREEEARDDPSVEEDPSLWRDAIVKESFELAHACFKFVCGNSFVSPPDEREIRDILSEELEE